LGHTADVRAPFGKEGGEPFLGFLAFVAPVGPAVAAPIFVGGVDFVFGNETTEGECGFSLSDDHDLVSVRVWHLVKSDLALALELGEGAPLIFQNRAQLFHRNNITLPSPWR